MANFKTLIIALTTFMLTAGHSDTLLASHKNLYNDTWDAKWITVPGTVDGQYGVFYFRKDISLASKPAEYIVHVTGDSRYKLYVNGEIVSLGPARSDGTHWRYETLDIAPKLKAGANVVAAVVYHEGEQLPAANWSVSTGFLLQGEGDSEILNTDSSWKCIKAEAYSPLKASAPGYYVAGPGELVDMSKMIAGWNTDKTGTDTWQNAKEGDAGQPKDYVGDGVADGHNLVESPLPQMELKDEEFATGTKMTIPANTTKDILLDMSHNTNAFFSMNFSGGKGAKLKVGYAEALYNKVDVDMSHPYWMYMVNLTKGNRNETDGKIFIGREDEIIPDGTDGQQFSTLAWRTYRYVRIHVETADQPLQINDAHGTFIGYPFKLVASLDTDDAEMQKMMEIGWRTARLCAIETYMDCPYYEQLQYLGDTRIQALISLYNSDDDRLVKNYLYMSDISRTPEGITMSRYPSAIPQYIQPYALSYIYAIHDYMMYGKDTKFAIDLIPGAEQILNYFSKYQMEDGRLKNLPGWNFSDWVYTNGWNNGKPKKGSDGASILMDLQLMLGYQMMSGMEEYNGNLSNRDTYAAKAEQIGKAVKAAYWDSSRGLFANSIEKDDFSQHAGALAILCGLVKGDDAKVMAQKLLEDKSLAQCTVYYKFYLHEALVKAGLGDDYMNWLDIWKENMAQGLTTWAETSDIDGTRSDCHAWGASPNIEFFRTVLGIDSDAVAFKKVKIEPHLGDIKEIGGTMPHPDGKIAVHYNVKNGKLSAEVNLPQNVSGKLVWAGKEYSLTGGENIIKASTR